MKWIRLLGAGAKSDESCLVFRGREVSDRMPIDAPLAPGAGGEYGSASYGRA